MVKKGKTKYELEKEKKKELQENEEYFNQVDKPGGREFVVDDIQEGQRKEQKSKDDILTDLQQKKSKNISYKKSLSEYGNWLLEEIHEKDWEMQFVPTYEGRMRFYNKSMNTKDGLALVLKDRSGNLYMRGMAVTYKPMYDEQAVKTFVVQAENTIDSAKKILLSDKKKEEKSKLNKKLKKNKSGIYI